MHGLQKKKTIKKLLYSKIFLLLLLVGLGFMLKETWDIYGKERRSQQNAAVAKDQLNNLKVREAALEGEVGRLSTPEGIEGELREKYTITREGEDLYVVVPTKKEEGTASSEVQVDQSWWAKLKGLFN